MSSRDMGCEAYQVSDQMNCTRCHLVWDMNDSEPPECLTSTEISRNNMYRASKRLNDMMPTAKQAAENIRKAFGRITQKEINRRNLAKLKKVLK